MEAALNQGIANTGTDPFERALATRPTCRAATTRAHGAGFSFGVFTNDAALGFMHCHRNLPESAESDFHRLERASFLVL